MPDLIAFVCEYVTQRLGAQGDGRLHSKRITSGDCFSRILLKSNIDDEKNISWT